MEGFLSWARTGPLLLTLPQVLFNLFRLRFFTCRMGQSLCLLMAWIPSKSLSSCTRSCLCERSATAALAQLSELSPRGEYSEPGA